MNDHATGSSFHLPLRFLSSRKRRAMHTLYAFCRAADDAVDDATGNAKQRLMTLRAAIYNIYNNPLVSSADPLRTVIQHYGLRREYFDAILDGMEMDMGGQMLHPSLATLTLYCYRVAGCVGLLSLPVFGNAEPQAEKFAIALGHALQLTNILRDLQEDAARGRLYLPLEWVEEEGIVGITPNQLHDHKEAVGRICERLARLAEQYFAEAELSSRDCNRRRLLPALLMRDIYQGYLQALVAGGDFPGSGNVRFHFWQKLAVAAGAVRYLSS